PLFASILERIVEFVSHLPICVLGDANATRLRNAFKSGGDVDPVAKNIALFNDDVPDVNTDAELYLPVRRHRFVPQVHPTLDFNGAAPCVYRTCELDQDSIACSLDDAAAMFGDLRFEKLAPVCVEALQRALFLCTHEPTVAGDIPGE